MSTDSATPATIEVGLLIFPQITQLDITGPFEVLSRVPGVRIRWIWKTLEPITSDTGMTLTPTTTMADCPPLDVICVPGGPGMNALLNDEETLAFLRSKADGARFVTSVCTGCLVLAAAGLLNGVRSSCHWLTRDMLGELGAIPVAERVVVDGKHISGAGVTAGIDFGFTVAAALAGEAVAREIQLFLEYDPQPPFGGASPEKSGPEVVGRVRAKAVTMLEQRGAAVRRAAQRMAAAAASS